MDSEVPGRSAAGRDGGRPGQGTTPPEAIPPQATQPEATPPESAQPEAAPPQATQPQATQPEAAPPQATQPQATQPEAVPPQATPPGAVPPQATQPQVTQPEAIPPEATRPEAAQPEAAPPEAAPPEAAPPEAASPEAAPSSPAPGPAAARADDSDQDHGGGAPGTGVPLLSLQGAAKSFGAVHAIVDASIDLYGGEVHGLVGENGAGKSTLVKILAGVHRPDSGQLLVKGTPTVLHGPAAAQDAGIAVIYQEPTLFPDLTAAENIFMGRQPLRRGRRIDARQMRAQARALFERLGVRLDPGRICRGLSIADQQIIEIAKALSLEARVIVMDEPTAALSAAEVARLFDVAATLRASGAAVLFISHRLEEVFEICQRVTVMRDGRRVLSRELAGLTADDLVRAMVGRQLDDRAGDVHHTPGEVVLRVERLTREGVFTDVSFDVRAGEIVAFAGLVGSGRSEIARAIFGIDHYDAGSVAVGGRRLRGSSPTSAMAAGVGFVPEDRRQQGLVMDMSVQQNMALASLGRLRRAGIISSKSERNFAADWALRLRIKFGRLTDPVAQLSGGNQQKVVLAKWLGRQPSLLIVDEPTRGIDIATKAEVHRLLSQLAGNGVAILMISSELPEVLRVGDRILVMREGRLVAEYPHAEASEETIMSAATGQLQGQAR